jgi:hypothetical protein
MRRCIVSALVALGPALASAQETGDDLRLTRDVEADRFPDGDVAGPSWTSGTVVTVVVARNDQVRVMAGDRFGWVPPDALEAADAEPTDGE